MKFKVRQYPGPRADGFVLLLACVICSAIPASDAAAPNLNGIVPLYNSTTVLEPAATEDAPGALITHIADRVRDRHAREAKFHAYDHYLPFYWEERTVSLEIVDKVAKGGTDIVVNVTSLAPLNNPNFRCFFQGKSTVAEYSNNMVAKLTSPNHYSTTINQNATERRGLKIGDHMEFEFSPFLVAPKSGRKNYYGTAMLYVVGKGIVPWMGGGERLNPVPLPESALLGGRTTLSYQYSDEPGERFKQIASNMTPASAQAFMQGRRLHHTDFADGSHSEKGNPVYAEQRGKLGPQFVARSCVACHVNNGRALPPAAGAPMYQSVIKVAANAQGAPHSELGSALQPQSISGPPEATAAIESYTTIEGKFGDGTAYTLQKPNYTFKRVTPEFYSVRLTPQLVGLGLLEAIDESTVLALAESQRAGKDGISGHAQILIDPESGEKRLGRFGYKAGQARVSHQIAGALNSDMGITTAIFPKPDGAAAAENPELSAADLANMTRYISTLGVSARRNLNDADAMRGEKLFESAHCSKCHVSTFTTSAHHPFAELRSQAIHPYTDLLLHNMGPGLADNLGEHEASGAEWRTAPLWSIGLIKGVSGGKAFLHDGRARTFDEAILWHGGEAESAKEAFRAMPSTDRAALVKFLESL